MVNIIEHGQALVITGSSSDLAAGSNVTLTINGQTYVAAVLADGSWSVGVPAVDVSAWPAGTVTITASGNTTAGNPVSVTHPVTVDLTAVAVSINAITADDVINAAEKGAALTLSGSTSGVEAGQTVTVTFGGKTYTASVAANGSGVPRFRRQIWQPCVMAMPARRPTSAMLTATAPPLPTLTASMLPRQR